MISTSPEACPAFRVPAVAPALDAARQSPVADGGEVARLTARINALKLELESEKLRKPVGCGS